MAMVTRSRTTLQRLTSTHNQRLKLTGAAILFFRASTFLQAAPVRAFGRTSMKRGIAVLSVLLIGLIGAFVGYRWNSDNTQAEYDGVYREYDREFRAHLASATKVVGKETIHVERLSDQFTVPQK